MKLNRLLLVAFVPMAACDQLTGLSADRNPPVNHSDQLVPTIDLQARLPAPQGLSSISLNAAVQLYWSNNAVDASRATFDHYRVYSAAYDATRAVCTVDWRLEGSPVSAAFLVAGVTNGVSRCFAVSAVTHDGHESVWSDARLETPRVDARNALVYAYSTRPPSHLN